MSVKGSPDSDGSFTRTSTRAQIDGVVVSLAVEVLVTVPAIGNSHRTILPKHFPNGTSHATLGDDSQPSFDRTHLAIAYQLVPSTSTLPSASVIVTMASKAVKLVMVVSVWEVKIPNHMCHNNVCIQGAVQWFVPKGHDCSDRCRLRVCRGVLSKVT